MISDGLQERRWPPLPRDEVVRAVERRGPARIPLVRAKWWGEGLEEQYGERLRAFDRYPEDVAWLWIEMLDVQSMGLSWDVVDEGAHDARAALPDWGKLDEFVAKMPDPETDPQFETLIEQAREARAEDRYVLCGWWRLFFERPWAIRGMTDLLMDYHRAPEQVHRLHRALCDLYCGYLERAIRELRPDGFWTSDDLGHQTQLFMSPRTFRDLIKPYSTPSTSPAAGCASLPATASSRAPRSRTSRPSWTRPCATADTIDARTVLHRRRTATTKLTARLRPAPVGITAAHSGSMTRVDSQVVRDSQT